MLNPVAIVMGSLSDYPIMIKVIETLKQFEVTFEVKVISAHRTPHEMLTFAQSAQHNYSCIIAAAGGAAHLPGMLAAATILPVIGVPTNITPLHGLDALLSIVQMPKGVPVATVAIDNGINAALLAIRILAIYQSELKQKLIEPKPLKEFFEMIVPFLYRFPAINPEGFRQNLNLILKNQ